MKSDNITRRAFVATGAAATAGVALAGATSFAPEEADALTKGEPLGGEWIRTTCSPNCTGACGIDAWVEDGKVRLLRQAADYPYEHYNPRGCL